MESEKFMANDSAVLDTAAKPATPPYTGFRWAVLGCSCLTVLAFQIGGMAPTPLLGTIARDLGVDLAQGVNLMTIFMLFATLSFFPAGLLSDRLGVHNLLILSTVFAAVPPTCLLLLGHSYPLVLVVRALQGCAVGFALAGMAPLVLQWFPPHQRGLALGLPGACLPFAVLIAVLLSPVLVRLAWLV